MIFVPQTDEWFKFSETLRKMLNIPEHVKWFEVRVSVDEPITVKCEFFHSQKEAEE